VGGTLLLSDDELEADLLVMTDAFTDELFVVDEMADVGIICPVSRLVVDPERFVEDSQEPMSKIGMGAVYTQTSHRKALRAGLTDTERRRLLEEYFLNDRTCTSSNESDTLTLQVKALLAAGQWPSGTRFSADNRLALCPLPAL
jgi:hypothetical protein